MASNYRNSERIVRMELSSSQISTLFKAGTPVCSIVLRSQVNPTHSIASCRKESESKYPAFRVGQIAFNSI